MNEIVWVPLEELTTPPPGIIQHYKDYWWVFIEGRGAAFVKYQGSRRPLCNMHKAIVERQLVRFEGSEARFIPSAFERVNISDYM